MRDLLQRMAWQVRELGLHKIATSQLYSPHDMVQPLTAAFVYTDTSVHAPSLFSPSSLSWSVTDCHPIASERA